MKNYGQYKIHSEMCILGLFSSKIDPEEFSWKFRSNPLSHWSGHKFLVSVVIFFRLQVLQLSLAVQKKSMKSDKCQMLHSELKRQYLKIIVASYTC